MGLLLLVVDLLLIFSTPVRSQPDEFQISVTISCTEQECDEGYFEVSPRVMLVVDPKSEFYRWLKANKGHKAVWHWRLE